MEKRCNIKNRYSDETFTTELCIIFIYSFHFNIMAHISDEMNGNPYIDFDYYQYYQYQYRR